MAKSTTKSIKIYTTPTWPYCHRAKEFLGEKGISFAEVDVSTDEEGRREMITKTGQMGVPVIVVDEEIIIGFDQPKLEEAIK